MKVSQGDFVLIEDSQYADLNGHCGVAYEDSGSGGNGVEGSKLWFVKLPQKIKITIGVAEVMIQFFSVPEKFLKIISPPTTYDISE